MRVEPYRPSPARGRRARAPARRASSDSFDAPYATPRQVLGRRSTIGCVALEVTQRCNLDCTLCYLSDYSESVPDPPLDELKRKADNIKRLFGVQTNVQITGGDPTLRKRDELVEIVRYVASIGLNPALFTNGIRASRDLLAELRSVGLVDVAFHVDVTQERKGYTSELQLNEIREEYLERARGLGLAVIFNTTVCDENLDELPQLVVLRGQGGRARHGSFQMQADTGRGILHRRGRRAHQAAHARAHRRGLRHAHQLGQRAHRPPRVPQHRLRAGRRRPRGRSTCSTIPRIVERFLADFATVPLDRSDVPRSALAVARHIFAQKPAWLTFGGLFAARLVAKVARAMVRTRSTRVGKLSFFMQNFQDADALDAARIQHCSFYVATRDGAISMCEHNARRDDYIIPANLVRGVDIQPSRPPIAAGAARRRAPPDQMMGK